LKFIILSDSIFDSLNLFKSLKAVAVRKKSGLNLTAKFNPQKKF